MTTGGAALNVLPAAVARMRAMPATGWVVLVCAVGAAAWAVALMTMADMDAGPGTALHSLPFFVVSWVVMLSAMMLPSELAYVATLAALVQTRGRSARRVLPAFVSGYGLAWIGYGVVAWSLDRIVRTIAGDALSWTQSGPVAAATVLIVAGCFQVSRLKAECLKHCRTPMGFFARNWREGTFGALAMGVQHGTVCVACCWALMAVMFAVGAMSLTWMALLTVMMMSEKLLPRGDRLTLPIACLLWAMGLWIALSPATAPMLKDPLVFGSLCRSRG